MSGVSTQNKKTRWAKPTGFQFHAEGFKPSATWRRALWQGDARSDERASGGGPYWDAGTRKHGRPGGSP